MKNEPCTPTCETACTCPSASGCGCEPKTTETLAFRLEMLKDEERELERNVRFVLHTWTAMWRDAYDMTARILATSAADCAEISEKINNSITGPAFSLRTYNEWRSAMRESHMLCTPCGDFDYNPLNGAYDVGTELSDWAVEDGYIVCDTTGLNNSWKCRYKIPGWFFDVLRTDGHSAARALANAYFLEEYILPYLDNRLLREDEFSGEYGIKALKSDLTVLKKELENVREAKEELADSANTLILVDAIEALYEEKIDTVKAKRKKLKKALAK